MAYLVKEILTKPVQLADQVIKAADKARAFKQDCAELKSKTEKLASLLRQAVRASSDLYERPTRRIIDDTEQVLDKALALVQKCEPNDLMTRVFTILPAAAFRKMSSQLENSIGDVSWLLRISALADDCDDEYLGLPPIAANEPILCLVWEQIAILYTGSPDDRSDAAASLVSLARDNDRYGKLIIEEGGIPPLLKLVKEGKMEGQENAARAIGLLGRDQESVESMIHAGVCIVFAKILKEGPMKVQAVVAWAVSELAANYPACQDLFAQNSIIRLLVAHLAFETAVDQHVQSTIPINKATSVLAVVMARNHLNASKAMDEYDNYDDQKHNLPPYQLKLSGTGFKEEFEDPNTKARMKAMAAKALSQLAKGNSSICRSIIESRALMCFVVLLEKGSKDVKCHSAMALMEVTAVAMQDPDLRRSTFKHNSPATKVVVDQIVKNLEREEDSDIIIPCIKTIGNLARTLRETETRMIVPLVKLLAESEDEVSREASIALSKFACTENYLHLDHSKAIIQAGGEKSLIRLVYFGDQTVQLSALYLLCYIAVHVPDSEELAQAKVLTVLEWASKQSFMNQDETIESLLEDAKSKLERYQSRGSRGFH
ncbi:hypothetical protein P3X46_015884 [Hevea brasiliensis]|uniref:DUF7792 domain-containing protein n=1 Tax=Hevea brasiliensis TaxID=3981 RepID=A0ABQ9LZS2_HEVBR|nr:uncharacterized protein LOC110663906 [Hevea brasiliensis]KAJ9172670.1 hypothetical protein P3X46_015884 [Hevea brasiliensis]